MEWRIDHRPAYSLLRLHLTRGESVWFEAGAYVYHKGSVEFRTTSGGIGAALKRALLGGESFFLNQAIAKGDTELGLAPAVPGDIAAVEFSGALLVQDTSYLAHVGRVRVTTRWMGIRGLFAEGEAFWLSLEGEGLAFLASYGGVEEHRLGVGEKMTVDNGHIVALDASVGMRIRKFGGLKSFLFGGEGLVVELTGPGRVWIQSRTLPPFAALIYRLTGRG